MWIHIFFIHLSVSTPVGYFHMQGVVCNVAVNRSMRVSQWDPDFLPLTLYSWIQDLRIRPASIKLLEEDLGNQLLDTDLSRGFSGMNQKHRLRPSGEGGLRQTQKLGTAQAAAHKWKGSPRDGEGVARLVSKANTVTERWALGFSKQWRHTSGQQVYEKRLN